MTSFQPPFGQFPVRKKLVLAAGGKAGLLQLSLILSAPPVQQIHGVLKTLWGDFLRPTSGQAGRGSARLQTGQGAGSAMRGGQLDGANPPSDVGERLPTFCKLVSHTLSNYYFRGMASRGKHEVMN